MTRNGKIARLPRVIRDELNRSLRNGEQGKNLVPWLNALPQTQAMLAREFGGRQISEQNLSEWKSGGYREWLAQQDSVAHASELAANAAELMDVTNGRLTDHLATDLAARYAGLLSTWNGEITEEFRRKMTTLRWLCQDIVELRRGDHSGARINMERERLDQEREKTDEEVLEHFKEWVNKTDVRDWICRHWKCPEERNRRLREILGLQPDHQNDDPTAAPEPDMDQTQSNPIKPDQTTPPP